MMLQTRQILQVFLLTGESACPYLPGRRERKLVTDLSGSQAKKLYETLSRAGFRRSHTVAYRPACASCNQCQPIRIPVQKFQPGRSLRRTMRRNSDLSLCVEPARATWEHYSLFKHYLDMRHADGEMVGMNEAEFSAMIQETPLDSVLVALRDADERLKAACLVDRTSDGLSAVYSYFDPLDPTRSLGSAIILHLIALARREDRPYVYLGYWVPDSKKMAYKSRFRPMEIYGSNGWSINSPSSR